jgi:hypothetical protein
MELLVLQLEDGFLVVVLVELKVVLLDQMQVELVVVALVEEQVQLQVVEQLIQAEAQVDQVTVLTKVVVVE